MHYVSIFDNITKKRLCFLENAFNVGYTLNLNRLHEAKFSLPLSDPKNAFCQVYRYVEIWDESIQRNGGRVGLFRILPTAQTKTADTRQIDYTCEHVLATLMDDVMFGWHEIGNVGTYTNEVLGYVLAQQRSIRWNLLECDFTHQYLYGWENENLLSALFSVPNCFEEAYTWKYDTSDMTHWNISLKAVDPSPVAEIRYKKNLKGITKTTDPTDMATRLIPLGYGEGINQLNVSNLNGGSMVLEADTISQYGEITRVWTDRRYQDESSLYAAGLAMLEELKKPYVSYTVDTSMFGLLAEAQDGDFVRVIDDEDNTDFLARVIQISKEDVNKDPTSAKVTLANRAKDIATSLSDMADRSRINETYAQGAVTVYTMSFSDNADASHPAEIRFPIPESVVHINSIMLDGVIENARGYSNAVSTTEASTIATEGGGGATRTSSSTTLESANIENTDDGGLNAKNHNHGITRNTRLAVVNSNNEITGSVGWTPSGAHNHAAHDHDVSIPSHTHSVKIPKLSINNSYGIYESGRADWVKIKVDNVQIIDPDHPNGQYDNISDLNITTAFTGAGDGNITRGWHTLQITPNKLTRINVSLAVQLFANSRGGGQY